MPETGVLKENTPLPGTWPIPLSGFLGSLLINVFNRRELIKLHDSRSLFFQRHFSYQSSSTSINLTSFSFPH